MGFPRQEYWSVLSFPSPEDLSDPEIELVSPMSPALQAESLLAEPSGKPIVFLTVCQLQKKTTLLLVEPRATLAAFKILCL